MNLPEVQGILTLLGTALDRQIPEGLDQIWAATLDDVPYDFGRPAALEAIKTSPFLPKVSDIRIRAAELGREHKRALREAEERRAIEAYAAEAGPLKDRSADIRGLVEQVRTVLPEGDPEALRPRARHWEREHAAHQRQANAVPNPLFDPSRMRPVEWQRSKLPTERHWWEDEAARERHCRELLAESGRLYAPDGEGLDIQLPTVEGGPIRSRPSDEIRERALQRAQQERK